MKIEKTFILSLLLSLSIFSCDKDDEVLPTITTNDFAISINENPQDNDRLGTVSAIVENGSAPTYSLSDQSVGGALAINSTSGLLTVANAISFDHETNPIITAVYTVRSGTVEAIGNITITITDVSITANTFLTSIDENPANNTVLGTLSASINDSSILTYSLIYQSITGAMNLDGSTGELTVADSIAFDFETNTELTATYTVSNGNEEATGNIIININDVVEILPFVTTWHISSANEDITIPTDPAFTYEYIVDWGDGSRSTETGDATHTYAMAGNYQVSISVSFPAIRFENDTQENKDRIISINQWGGIVWQGMSNAFSDCTNLTVSATDFPYLDNVEDMSFMFSGASSLNVDLSGWDVSNVTNMVGMFANAISFNSDLSSWDVSNVTNMNGMFVGASSFNGDLSGWDVSNVNYMVGMLANAVSFNGDLSTWNVSSVTDMSGMFFSAISFDGDLNSWDVSNVTNMRDMFSDAISFNGDLSTWNVSSVTDMSSMFANARSFNGDLSGWDVSSVADMSTMFANARSFNGELSGWNVSNVTNMVGMFAYAISFNGDLATWNVSSVIDMSNMFVSASSFNGDLSSWDVSNVTNMYAMFEFATSFNGDLGTWNVSNVTDMRLMFRDASSFNRNLTEWSVDNVTDCIDFNLRSGLGIDNLPNFTNCNPNR